MIRSNFCSKIASETCVTGPPRELVTTATHTSISSNEDGDGESPSPVPKPCQGNYWAIPNFFKPLVDLLGTLTICTTAFYGLERYAGDMAITKAFEKGNRPIQPFDNRTVHKDMSTCTDVGFIFLFKCCMDMMVGAFSWSGVVCKTWVWISRSTFGRSILKPYGNLNMFKVRMANMMVAREILLMLLLACKSVHQFMENPLSSIIDRYPKFPELKQLLDITHSVHSLGNYGAESKKPIKVFSTVGYLNKACKRFDPKLMGKRKHGSITTKKKSKSGKVSVSGGPGLTHSQAYPRGFGEMVHEMYMNHRHENPAPLPVQAADDFISKYTWNDSGIPQLIQRLCW